MAAQPKPAAVPPSTSDRFPSGLEMFGETVDITVGTGLFTARKFKVHKRVLCFYSGYFRAALEGKFKEASEGSVNLPTEDPDTFDTFTLWLYSRRFANPTGEDDTKHLTFIKLVKLWVFGDARQIPLLQNEVLNFIHRKMVNEWTINQSVIAHIYENTTASSGLRKFYIEALAKTGGASTHLSGDSVKSYTKEALNDILQMVWKDDRKAVSKTQLEKWDLCRYHVHEEGVKCKKGEIKK